MTEHNQPPLPPKTMQIRALVRGLKAGESITVSREYQRANALNYGREFGYTMTSRRGKEGAIHVWRVE